LHQDLTLLCTIGMARGDAQSATADAPTGLQYKANLFSLVV